MKRSTNTNGGAPYRIEKGIAVAPRRGGGQKPRPLIYPFENMGPGDSFLVPAATSEETGKARKSLQRQQSVFRKRFGAEYAFAVRTVEGGVRCWRTK